MIKTDKFVNRHNGPRANDIAAMLEAIGAHSLDELIEQTVPAAIRLKAPLNLPEGMSEYQYHKHLRGIAAKNKVFRTYIGLGYYNTSATSWKILAGTPPTRLIRPRSPRAAWKRC